MNKKMANKIEETYDLMRYMALTAHNVDERQDNLLEEMSRKEQLEEMLNKHDSDQIHDLTLELKLKKQKKKVSDLAERLDVLEEEVNDIKQDNDQLEAECEWTVTIVKLLLETLGIDADDSIKSIKKAIKKQLGQTKQSADGVFWRQ